jgi:acetyltransferase-like isoleucine patch superfamily enzyme
LNLIILKKNKVFFSYDFIIHGKIYVSNMGSIKIGKQFKANSGKHYNPIGGDIILRLICLNGAELKIGDNCGISNSTIVCQKQIVIGNNVKIGGSVKIWDTDFHSTNPTKRASAFDDDIKSAPILIKDNAFIGGAAIILKGVIIGANSIVAAGSIITKNIPDNEIWGGNPARFIKKNES